MSDNDETALDVLVVGATGSIGRPVVEASLRAGHRTRALLRDTGRAASLPVGAQIVVGDLTDAATLAEACDRVHAVVFVHGSHGGAREAEQVDYRGFDSRPGLVTHTTSAAVPAPASRSAAS